MKNKNNKRIMYGDLKNGMQVVVAGRIFKVSKVETGTINPNIVRFVGTCTVDKCNDKIRHTDYNNGIYIACVDEECCIISEAKTKKKSV